MTRWRWQCCHSSTLTHPACPNTHKRTQVLQARSGEGEAVGDAMEMAVLSSVQHPNIVQVFSCLTDVVEDAGARTDRGSGVNDCLA